MFLTVLAAVVVLGLVIFVHELGHFLAAKAVGVGVPRFSIGFGAATPLRFRRGETEYVVAWIPLGGYVKMATREEETAGVSSIEGGEAEGFPPEKLFENKSLGARIFVISAGVIMNVVLAWVLYTAVAATGVRLENPTTALAVADTAALPPGAEALGAVPMGTRIVRINGDTVESWNDVQRALFDATSERLRFDFAGGVDPAIVRIPGTAASARQELFRVLEPYTQPRIGEVVPGNPAAEAGLRPGDVVLRASGDTVRYWGQLVRVIEANAGAPVLIEVRRGDSVVPLTVTPAEQPKPDPMTGEERLAGWIGVGSGIALVEVEWGFGGALVEGGRRTVDALRQVVYAVRGIVLGRVSPRDLGGPIVIGQLSGQMAALGPLAFMSFIAFISVNLAIFNLLPIPVLDGGHLVFLVLEGMRGKPVSARVRLWFTQAGLLILLLLVVFIVFNDLTRVLG